MLDFTEVSTQIGLFTTEQARALPQFQAARAEAEDRLRASGPAWEQTQPKIARSRTSWLVAEWREPPDSRVSLPACPSPCAVLAADGSQIVSDRHDIARCCLLNVGLIALHYGKDPRATLTSRPTLTLSDDLMADDSALLDEPETLLPRRLAIRRQLAEFAGLADLIAESGAAPPTLALFDGSLILWSLETETPAFRDEALARLQAHQETARRQGVPMVGYISDPRSRDVVNALRVFRCPHPGADCDRYCPGRSRSGTECVAPPCAGTERVTDADLFAQLLRPGERSAVFGSRSKILRSYDEEYRVCFFYLHTGREVARVEMPNWVASDPDALRRTHALCADQAQKGDGYPVALAEAHEQAVIRGPEREMFRCLMEQRFVEMGLQVAVTQKAVSKRARRL